MPLPGTCVESTRLRHKQCSIQQAQNHNTTFMHAEDIQTDVFSRLSYNIPWMAHCLTSFIVTIDTVPDSQNQWANSSLSKSVLRLVLSHILIRKASHEVYHGSVTLQLSLDTFPRNWASCFVLYSRTLLCIATRSALSHILVHICLLVSSLWISTRLHSNAGRSHYL